MKWEFSWGNDWRHFVVGACIDPHMVGIYLGTLWFEWWEVR